MTLSSQLLMMVHMMCFRHFQCGFKYIDYKICCIRVWKEKVVYWQDL